MQPFRPASAPLRALSSPLSSPLSSTLSSAPRPQRPWVAMLSGAGVSSGLLAGEETVMAFEDGRVMMRHAMAGPEGPARPAPCSEVQRILLDTAAPPRAGTPAMQAMLANDFCRHRQGSPPYMGDEYSYGTPTLDHSNFPSFGSNPHEPEGYESSYESSEESSQEQRAQPESGPSRKRSRTPCGAAAHKKSRPNHAQECVYVRDTTPISSVQQRFMEAEKAGLVICL